jgi:threonine dehydrogenase-like Zn-dependent dehydrogenase
MKAIAIHPQRRDVSLVEHPEPDAVGDEQVLVRILDVGVCGTDREICAFEYGTPPPGADHLVIGHESLGEVIATGRAVREVAVGDLVVPSVRRPCRHAGCVPCRAGRQDFCTTGEFAERGISLLHGFMTERIVDEAKYMNRVPQGLREVAVLVEPLTIVEKALAQVWQIQSRLPWLCEGRQGPRAHCRKALVLGAGPVGLLGAMALVEAGFETHVYARGKAAGPRVEVLDEIGARYISGEEVLLGEAARQIGNVDLVFEGTGASKVSFDALPYLGVNGIFVLTGVPGRRGPVEIDTDLLMRNLVLKNQVLCGTVNAGRVDFEAAIRDLGTFFSKWPAAVRKLISGRHPVGRARELLLRPPQGIKEVVSFA